MMEGTDILSLLQGSSSCELSVVYSLVIGGEGRAR